MKGGCCDADLPVCVLVPPTFPFAWCSSLKGGGGDVRGVPVFVLGLPSRIVLLLFRLCITVFVAGAGKRGGVRGLCPAILFPLLFPLPFLVFAVTSCWFSGVSL